MSIITHSLGSGRFLPLFIAVAFLAMQWIPAHAHLNTHHHDSIENQHQTKIHAHSISSQIITIDVPHQQNHVNTVELNHQNTVKKTDKKHSFSTFLLSKSARPFQPFFLAHPNRFILAAAKLNHFDLTTVNPRAPPFNS